MSSQNKKEKVPAGLFAGLDNSSFEPPKKDVPEKKQKKSYIEELKTTTSRKAYDISMYNQKRLGMYKAHTGKSFNEIVDEALTIFFDEKKIKLMEEQENA